MKTAVILFTVLAFAGLLHAETTPMPEKCPGCGKVGTLREILYGSPTSLETMQRAEKGEIVFGGSIIDLVNPRWECINCKLREVPPLIQMRVVKQCVTSKTDPRTSDDQKWIQLQKDGEWYLFEDGAFEIRSVKDAVAQPDEGVVITLGAEDTERFHNFTGQQAEKQIVVFVFGEFCITPRIMAPISSGTFQLAGLKWHGEQWSGKVFAEHLKRLSEKQQEKK